MLHYLLQECGIMPDTVYTKPRGVKNFIYASTLLKLEQLEKANK
jgi:hypothetical protein